MTLGALSGGLLALAFPGTGDQSWLAFGALVPLLVAIEGTTWRRAGMLGFVSGLVFWLVTLPWVAPTMVRYGGLPWSLASLILLGLAGYLALYWSAFCALLARSQARSGALHVVVAASLWVALEFLRTYLFTGFPWNLLGYSQHGNLPLIQVASVTGVYGVSFVVAAVNAGLAHAILGWTTRQWPVASLGTGASFLLGALAYGWLFPPVQGATPSIRVALVQGNIDQGVKWDLDWQHRTLEIYRDLTLRVARERPSLIVWPETAVPFFLREDPRRREVEALARATEAYLLVGAPDLDDGRPRNSAFLIGPEGGILGRYDKRHLVPFGEYVPLKQLLFFVNALASGAIGEYVPGREATVFSTALGRLGVVICYEAIFPDEVREFFLGGADFLVNITNDAWFGRSAAPAQHLAMAAFRAVENRAYLIRAANTGISAIVAPDGRIMKKSGLFTQETLSAMISPRTGVTLYTRYGDFFAWSTVALALAVLLASLQPIGLPVWTADTQGAPAAGLKRAGSGRRGLLTFVLLGAGSLAAAILSGLRPRPVGRGGYREVARWWIPGGEGRYVAVDPGLTPDTLRVLGVQLREEFRDVETAVVMIFDDPEAALEARRGSRIIGDERFQTALAHQRAMYLKQAARGEHRLVIYDRYPNSREIIRY